MPKPRIDLNDPHLHVEEEKKQQNNDEKKRPLDAKPMQAPVIVNNKKKP
jgi:hypothetical protein